MRPFLLLLLAACAAEQPPAAPAAPPPPEACTVMRAPYTGPLAGQVSAARDALAIAWLHVKEARLTGDEGFYTLAEQAVECADAEGMNQREVTRARVHLMLQQHRFVDAETHIRPHLADAPTWQDWMLLSDALIEQGRIADASDALDRAMNLRPGLPLYERAAWISWLRGDLDAALSAQAQAVSAGTAADPEPYAWVLTRMGWLKALAGQSGPELEQALQLLPGYRPALIARGRLRLHQGDVEGARADLRAAGGAALAAVALVEIDPSVDVAALSRQDRRTTAIWLAESDPKAALALLDAELKLRKDPITRMGHAWATFKAGGDGRAEAEAALATGIIEPEALWQAGQILGRNDLLAHALAMGPGLLPSQRRLAEERVPANQRLVRGPIKRPEQRPDPSFEEYYYRQ